MVWLRVKVDTLVQSINDTISKNKEHRKTGTFESEEDFDAEVERQIQSTLSLKPSLILMNYWRQKWVETCCKYLFKAHHADITSPDETTLPPRKNPLLKFYSTKSIIPHRSSLELPPCTKCNMHLANLGQNFHSDCFGGLDHACDIPTTCDCVIPGHPIYPLCMWCLEDSWLKYITGKAVLDTCTLLCPLCSQTLCPFSFDPLAYMNDEAKDPISEFQKMQDNVDFIRSFIEKSQNTSQKKRSPTNQKLPDQSNNTENPADKKKVHCGICGQEGHYGKRCKDCNWCRRMCKCNQLDWEDCTPRGPS